MFSEQQNNSRHLEEEFQMKENRFDKSMKEMEEREQTWQDERAEVVKEVQTLKAEATKMVNILAMEYEEENISEDKKTSLSQEVYSLQLVVEMRTGEVRNLRDQLARATQQLEQADIDKEKLRKATSRLEDLEEQIKMKNNLER
jgi:cation transport regulator ChaC